MPNTELRNMRSLLFSQLHRHKVNHCTNWTCTSCLINERWFVSIQHGGPAFLSMKGWMNCLLNQTSLPSNCVAGHSKLLHYQVSNWEDFVLRFKFAGLRCRVVPFPSRGICVDWRRRKCSSEAWIFLKASEIKAHLKRFSVRQRPADHRINRFILS